MEVLCSPSRPPLLSPHARWGLLHDDKSSQIIEVVTMRGALFSVCPSLYRTEKKRTAAFIYIIRIQRSMVTPITISLHHCYHWSRHHLKSIDTGTVILWVMFTFLFVKFFFHVFLSNVHSPITASFSPLLGRLSLILCYKAPWNDNTTRRRSQS